MSDHLESNHLRGLAGLKNGLVILLECPELRDWYFGEENSLYSLYVEVTAPLSASTHKTLLAHGWQYTTDVGLWYTFSY